VLDEMQDTSARQEALLNRLFPADAIDVQRFGDENQKIYDMDASAEESTTFPREPVLNLGESVRFGEFIASRIAMIAPRKQTILGSDGAPSGRRFFCSTNARRTTSSRGSRKSRRMSCATSTSPTSSRRSAIESARPTEGNSRTTSANTSRGSCPMPSRRFPVAKDCGCAPKGRRPTWCVIRQPVQRRS
jgi:hypothetical protein